MLSREGRTVSPRAFKACASCLAMVALLPAGSSVRSQTLDDASRAAIDTSYLLKGDRERQIGVQERLRSSLDAFMPTMAFTIDRPLRSRIAYSPDPLPTSIGFEGTDNTPRHAPIQYGFVASLPLFDGLKRYNQLQSARVEFEAGQNLTASQRQQVLLDVATAYLAVLRDARIVGFRQVQVAATERISAMIDRQFATSDATRTDVALARSRVEEAKALLDRAGAEAAASRLEFRRLTRMEPDRVAPPRLPDGLPSSEDAYARLVLSRNPSLIAARLNATSAEYAADAAKSEVLPALDFQVSRGSQYGYSAALDRITDTTARVIARIPIYEPGAFPRIGAAAAAARQRGFEVQDSELSTMTSARIAFERRLAIGAQAGRLRKRADELRATMRGYEIERGAGFRTVLDELNIQAELSEAEVAAAVAANDHDGLTFSLASAAGLLGTGRGSPLSPLPQPASPLPKAVAKVMGALRPTLRPGIDASAPVALRGSQPGLSAR